MVSHQTWFCTASGLVRLARLEAAMCTTTLAPSQTMRELVRSSWATFAPPCTGYRPSPTASLLPKVVGVALKRESLTVPVRIGCGPEGSTAVSVTGRPGISVVDRVASWLASLAHVPWRAPLGPMSTLMKSAMLRLPMLVMQPTVPCRQTSPMWLGPMPTSNCWNVGELVLPLRVTAMKGCHCLLVLALLGCSRASVPSQMKPSLPGSPAATQPMMLVAVAAPLSTWMGGDQVAWVWPSAAVSSEYE